MYLEQEIVVVCFSAALVLGWRAALLANRRVRLIVPTVALTILGVYELVMIRWEKTVHAPIRLDMVLEIPLIVIFMLWGGWAFISATRTRDSSGQDAGRPRER